MKKLIALALMLVSISTYAESQFALTWQGIYPNSKSLTNLPSACQLCHNTAGGGNNFNAYGAALKAQMGTGVSIDVAIRAVESMNSDNDTGSSTNIQEITASTQPGWTASSPSLPANISGLLDPTGVPPPPVCTYTYGPFGSCVAGSQSRTVASALPSGCTGTPSLTQTCVTPPNACTYTYGAWGACVNGSQARTVASALPTGCTGTPTTSQLCTVNPGPCTYTYSAWGVCGSNSLQTRTVATATPPACTGTPTLSQSCTPVIPPVPPAVAVEPADVTACGGGWPMSGYGIHNTRNSTTETLISPATVGTLQVQQTITLGGSIYPTLSVQGGFIFAPDKSGYVSKIDTPSGRVIWRINAAAMMGLPTAIVRVTPTLCNGQVIIAGWSVDTTSPSTAYVMSLSQSTGALKWKTLIDTDPGSRLFQSPIIYKGKIYIGVGGLGAELAGYINGPAAPAVSFRGSVVALDFLTGRQLWKTYMVPTGYSGGGVWSHTLVIDEKRSRLYAATGNNFSIPPTSMACLLVLGGDAGDMCQSPDNHIDSLVSMDLNTGAILKSKRMIPWDSYGCGPGCPALLGAPDYDFPAGVQLYTVNGKDYVGAGHKNGSFVTLNPDTWDIIWANKVGVGSSLGGIERECAIDATRVYCPQNNQNRALVTLKDGSTTQAGFWTAFDAATGVVLWQVANPTGGRAFSAVTVANGVVFVASLDPTGMIYALDGRTGAILWSHVTNGSNGGGVSVFNGRVYVGAGYGALDPYIDLGTPGNQVWVFAIPGAPSDPRPGHHDD